MPVWFVWDGSAFVVFSKPGALKVRHIAAEPRVAIALGEPEDDFDVQLVSARAELVDRHGRPAPPGGLVAKYGTEMARIGLSAEEYAATYSQVRSASSRPASCPGAAGPGWPLAAASAPARGRR